ncbi:hypothetical protein NMY22_g13074 [Coprinellus aureogranulatus]|nr:hypothetical protein NMY22_g13074 [Coprinellus aureogranulatus]
MDHTLATIPCTPDAILPIVPEATPHPTSHPYHTMESLGNPLQKLNEANLAKPLGDLAEPLKKFSEEPMEKTKRAAVATQNVVQSTFDPTYNPHSVAAQKIVLAKGFFDVFLSLSLIFFPSLLYDGPIPKALSFVTGLSKASWEADTNAAFALSSLIMGCGFAGIVAGESTSDDAYKVVAALNGIFALMALTGSILHPHKFGSSFLFIAGLQDVFWFTAIVKAGGFDVLETLGVPWKRVKKEADNMAGKAAKRYAANEAQGIVEGSVQGVQNEGTRVLSTNPFNPTPAKD